MNIHRFSAQTQRSLRQMDSNQDQRLNVRELQSLRNQDIVPGIDQADLMLIQQELKQSKSPEQTIISFIDPIAALYGPVDSKKTPSPIANPEFKIPVISGAKEQQYTEPSAIKFSFTPTQKGTESNDGLNPETIQAGEVKAVSDLGPLQVTGSSRFEANTYHGSKLNATLKASPKLEFNANLDAPTTPAGQNAPVKMGLGAQTQMGKLKLSTRSNFDESGMTKSALNTDLEVFKGHHLKTESNLTPAGLGTAKINSSHQLTQGVSLLGGIEIEPSSGHMPRQSVGLSYAAAKDAPLAGIKIQTEAKRTDAGFEAAKITTSKPLRDGVSVKGSLEFDANGNQKQGLGLSYSAASDSLFNGLSISAEAQAKSGSAAAGWHEPDLNLKMGYSIKF